MMVVVEGVAFPCVFFVSLDLLNRFSPDVWRRSVFLFVFSSLCCVVLVADGCSVMSVSVVVLGGSGKGEREGTSSTLEYSSRAPSISVVVSGFIYFLLSGLVWIIFSFVFTLFV